MTKLLSWGRLQYPDSQLDANTPIGFAEFLESKSKTKFLPVGAGRSYGDVGLNPGGLVFSTSDLNKFISFSPSTGVLECESGVLIRDIQAVFANQGWISPVTPGTSFVTVGGAIANDVHGKNHHSQGSFGNHVIELVLARSDGQVLTCSELENSELFRATIGGLGLTGVILRAKIQLLQIPSPWIASEKIAFQNLREFFDLSKESEREFESSVAWFDCSTSKAGRGSFTRGNHIASEKPSPPPPKIVFDFPLTPPVSLINRFTLNPMNISYYHLQRVTGGEKIESMWSFYYPLDAIKNWNRAYGPKGFYQYQSVVPAEVAASVTKEMVSRISRSGLGSFLAVLKTFGPRSSKGLLSFPMEGVTLALDFSNSDVRSERLFRELDQIVVEAGGRLNPSKDARMAPETFAAGYPRIEEFDALRDRGISSGFSKRIFGS